MPDAESCRDADNHHDHFFMEKALAVAREGLAHGELPVGAVVVANNQVIASAYTQEQSQGRLLVHADLLALQAADQIRPFPAPRRDVTLYVNLEPCLMCMGAAMSMFIGRVCYGLESPGDGAADIVRNFKPRADGFPAYHAPVLQGGVLRERNFELLNEYLQLKPDGPMADWVRHLLNATVS
jgi:tRNA(adenine34) deaminase